MKEMMVAVENIIAESNRQNGGEGDIRLLADDMAAVGLINSITLKRLKAGDPAYPKETSADGDNVYYKVVAGRRRYAAANLLGWTEIPSRVFEEGEEGLADAVAASENVNRLAMHPLDEAEIFRRLIERGESVESLTKRYDRSKAAIWQRVQLLDLSDGVKQLFRDGKISLHAAAMLKSLDAKQQEAFVAKCKKRIKGWGNSEFDDDDVEDFVGEIYNNRLYKCVAGDACKNCKKRTFYSDKTLFPELAVSGDNCLDNDCYKEKWRELLARRINSIDAKKHKDHKMGAVLIATSNSTLKKILGNNVTLDVKERAANGAAPSYDVKSIGYFDDRDDRISDKAGAGAQPCYEIDLDSGAGKLSVFPRYWKEAEKKDRKQKAAGGTAIEKEFAPFMKLLELPKEEAKQTAASLGKGCKDAYQAGNKASKIEDKVQGKVLDRLLKIKADGAGEEKDIDRFLEKWLDEGDFSHDAAKLFAGEASVKALRKLSWPKLFAAMYAGTISGRFEMPDIDVVAAGKENDFTKWAGVSAPQLREMYREELRAAMPKPEAAKEKGAKKPAKKKAGVRQCRVCGCTDDDCSNCIEETGERCYWVEDDLCSACVKLGKAGPGKKTAAPKKAKKTTAPETAKKKPAKKPVAKKQPARAAKAAAGKPARKNIKQVLERARTRAAVTKAVEAAVERGQPPSVVDLLTGPRSADSVDLSMEV